jgi:hypothetical protein
LSKQENIQNHLSTARAKLAALIAERDDEILNLMHAPGDTGLAAKLEQLRTEIAALEARVREFESALQAAIARDSSDGRRERRAIVKRHQAAALAKAEKRVALAAKIDKALATIPPLLAAWAEAGDDLAADVMALTQSATDDNKLRQRYQGPDLAGLSRGTSALFGCALVEQLARTGLFLDGSIPHPANVSPEVTFYISRGGMTMEQAATVAADRLAGVLGRFETLADAELGLAG